MGTNKEGEKKMIQLLNYRTISTVLFWNGTANAQNAATLLASR
jgi:hypothetical protein